MYSSSMPPPIPEDVLPSPMIDARSDCKHFHGRTTELRKLLSTVEDLPAALVAVVGAPGAGKTSLLAEFRKRLPSHICRVSLEPEHFMTDEALMFQVQQYLPRLDHFRKIIPEILAHVMDAGATTVAKTGGADIQIKAFSELLELRNLQSTDVTEPLRLLSTAFPSGYVITLDEAQNLGQYQDLPLARRFLHALHQNPNNENRPFGKGWLLLAGLNNLGTVLGKFGRYRISHTYSLSALQEEEANAVLMDHVASNLPSLSSQDRELVEQTWVPELVVRYRHWPHHLQGAATSLAHVVARGYISCDGFQTILYYADLHIENLYNSIFQRIVGANLELLSVLIAFLTKRNRGVITSTMVKELIRQVEGEIDREENARIMLKLQDIGLLQYESHIAATGISFPHFSFPIPSLLTWIVDARRLSNSDEAILAEVQNRYGAEVDAVLQESIYG